MSASTKNTPSALRGTQGTPDRQSLGLGPGGRDLSATSVGKALHLLDSFRNAGPTLGVTELARRAGVPKSTAFRLLAYLEQGGYVERAGTNYRLAWRLFELGNRVQHCRPRGLRDIAVPHMSDLHARTNHTVHLAVLEGCDIIYLEKIHGKGSVRTPTNVGARVPAACTGLGKSILAFGDHEVVERVLRQGLTRRTPYSIVDPNRFLAELAQVRTNGVAIDREEAALGLSCVAAPIKVKGQVIGAVSLSLPSARFDPVTNIPLVRRAAESIAADYRGV